MTRTNPFLARFGNQAGQTMAEYGVTLAVITVAVLAAFVALGERVQGAVSAVVALLS